MKMTLSKPVPVAYGPTWAEVGWGPWQFPSMRKDGKRVFAGVHVGQDSEDDYGLENKWFYSDDNGETWTPATREESDRGFVVAENGDRIFQSALPPVEVDPKIFEGITPVGMFEDYYTFYRFDDFPEGTFDRAFKMTRIRKGCTERETFLAPIKNFDDLLIRRINGTNKVLLPFMFGRLRKAPDGSLWFTSYDRGLTPGTGEFYDCFFAYFYRSDDNGESWELASVQDPQKTEGAICYCEQDICWLPSGRALTVSRSEGLHLAISDDGGYTWGKSVQLDTIGVDPAICALKCGAVLTSYGRPGFFVRACFDGKGEKWEEPVKINQETCSYSDIVAISDNEALVAFTEFHYTDENVENRKTLMVVKVTFEED